MMEPNQIERPGEEIYGGGVRRRRQDHGHVEAHDPWEHRYQQEEIYGADEGDDEMVRRRLQPGGARPLANARPAAGAAAAYPDQFLDRSYQAAPALADAAEIDKLFVSASIYTIIFYLILLVLVYVSTNDWNYLDAEERYAAAAAAMCLATTAVIFMVPIILEKEFQISGILMASLITQGLAFLTNAILACAPVPMRVDPLTRVPIYLVRWCEWVPLAGLQTFLSSAVVVTKGPGGFQESLSLTIWQVLACLAGFCLPYCPNLPSYLLCMAFALAAWFGSLLPLCLQKRRALRSTTRGATFLAMEYYNRVWFATNLLLTCFVLWSVLVFIYFLNIGIYMLLPDTHWLRHSYASIRLDAFFDVVSKAMYMKLIFDVHATVFDCEGRAQRQLAELRRLMNMLWDKSSDVICICIKHEENRNRVSAMLSPSFVTLVGGKLPEGLIDRNAMALLVEVELASFERAARTMWRFDVKSAHYVDSSAMAFGGDLRNYLLANLPTDAPLVRCAASIVRAVTSRFANIEGNNGADGGLLMAHPLQRLTGESYRCEIKLSRRSELAFTAIIRDVTERYRRFEAEQRAHSETVQRQLDATAANRFIGHEVKNGLLAGIDMCDTLRGVFAELEQSLQSQPEKYGLGADAFCSTETSRRILNEMDGMFHDVLDTVLAEVMARDVVHGVYRPRPERIDVQSLLSSATPSVGGADRLLIESKEKLPYLLLDPHLLKYIYRSAISNANRYGKPTGKVVTVVDYDRAMQLFEMKIMNEPGRGHAEIVAMGTEATEAVFRQETQLPANRAPDDPMASKNRISKGNGRSATYCELELALLQAKVPGFATVGAWIASECATAMEGTCRISFEPARTVFSFCCPAEALDVAVELPPSADFEVPPGTFGIALDDSAIQRKLIKRAFCYCGVDESRRIAIGESAEECSQLGAIVQKCLRQDPQSKVLVIVDENLDYSQGDASHSKLLGSVLMRDVIKSLPPEDECRVFALVRSANDSADDIAIYLERVHGFFPKAKMTRDRVREYMAPLWAERFMAPRESGGGSSNDQKEPPPVHIDAARREKLLSALQSINRLIDGKPATDVPWPQLRSALQALSDELMSIEGSAESLEMATMLTTSMSGGDTAPREFPTKWALISELVLNAAVSS